MLFSQKKRQLGESFRQRETASLRIEGSTGALEEAVAAFNDPQWHNYGFSVAPMNNAQSREWIVAFRW